MMGGKKGRSPPFKVELTKLWAYAIIAQNRERDELYMSRRNWLLFVVLVLGMLMPAALADPLPDPAALVGG